jgi:hypothetical protein
MAITAAAARSTKKKTKRFMAPKPERKVVNEKAVAVAIDVLKRLHYGKLNVKFGHYFLWKDDFRFSTHCKTDLQSIVDKVEKKCEVCLLGACLLSKARLYDEVTFGDIQHGSGSSEIKDKLSDVFSRQQSGLMEAAFESCSGLAIATGVDYVEANRATVFGDHCKTKVARIKAVMRNVIKNGGVFIP